MKLITAVTDALSTVIDWVGTVITEITGEAGALGELLPLLAVGIAISALLLGFKVIKSAVWGS